MSARTLSGAEEEAWIALHTLAQCLPTVMEQQLKRSAGLSYYEYAVLLTLSRAPERTLRMAELAETTNATLSRLSHTATRLAARGFLERQQRGPHRYLTLTSAGRRAFLNAATGHLEQMRTQVLDKIPQELLEPMTAALAPVVEGLRALMPRE